VDALSITAYLFIHLFIYLWFNGTVNSIGYIDRMTEVLMKNELERCERKQLWCNLMHYPAIFLRGTEENHKLSQESESSAQDLNSGPLKYKAEVLTACI
jgi:hypothetical protein